MGLFSFFSKRKDEKKEHNIDINLVKTDIHAHFLPGLDDGSPNMEESIKMIEGMISLGYQKLVCTPHVMHGYYQNSSEVILKSHKELVQAVKEKGIDIQLEVSAEYNFDRELLKRLDEDDIISFGNEDYQYLLFELSYFNEPMGLDELIAKIKEKGFIPVLAHPERYPYFSGNREKYGALQAQGVLFQVNLNSLSGLYPGGAKPTVKWLMEQGMVQFVASDAHRVEHVGLLNDALKHVCLHDLVDGGGLMNANV
ncbi:MAG: protein-tyrosine phosphatase [Glaciecola sp.]|jgi:protein-tyrosine phosphatase